MQMKEDLSKMLFLLGGYDLEMVTIRGVLESQGIDYADHQLNWQNAYVSSYRQEIDEACRQGWIVWGIELQEDVPVPPSYRKIDHHNECFRLSSALEQVLNMFHLPMDRYLQLVAANDKAYISGMLQLGATAEEVESIRRADRKAQGITDEDERLADKAIAENSERLGDLWMVRAFNSRFSPICDRLFPYHSLLVYTDKEWMYYGEGTMLVCKWFENDFKDGKVFFGGGENGYVGLKCGVYPAGKIQVMLEQIKNIVK